MVASQQQVSGSEAEVLARRFVEAVLDQANGHSKTSESFREVLLAATILHARQYSEYYRATLPETDTDSRFPLEKLCQLSVLTRAHLAENALSLRTSDEPGVVQNTTGTTGAPISVYRTESEVKFLGQFQSEVQKILHGTEPGVRPLILNLTNNYHGSVLDIPRWGYLLKTDLFDSVLLAQIQRWLTQKHSIPDVAQRISTIIGLYHHVEWLTCMLKEHGFDFTRCAVEQIYTSGGYLTSRWKALLERTWGAQIIPVYSLTEVFTYANLCVECGDYHFLPNVIPELVSPVNYGPLSGTTGQLLLTALYPFNQGQPAIRYATGDLFRRRSGRCWQGDGYHFAGRLDHSFILRLSDQHLVVMGSAELLDLFDDMAEVARFAFFRDLPGISGGTEIGRPQCGVEVITNSEGLPRIRFVAVLIYDPFLFSEAAARCKRSIEECVRQAFPELDEALKSGLCEIEVCCVSAGDANKRQHGTSTYGLEERGATPETAYPNAVGGR